MNAIVILVMYGWLFLTLRKKAPEAATEPVAARRAVRADRFGAPVVLGASSLRRPNIPSGREERATPGTPFRRGGRELGRKWRGSGDRAAASSSLRRNADLAERYTIDAQQAQRREQLAEEQAGLSAESAKAARRGAAGEEARRAAEAERKLPSKPPRRPIRLPGRVLGPIPFERRAASPDESHDGDDGPDTKSPLGVSDYRSTGGSPGARTFASKRGPCTASSSCDTS